MAESINQSLGRFETQESIALPELLFESEATRVEHSDNPTVPEQVSTLTDRQILENIPDCCHCKWAGTLS